VVWFYRRLRFPDFPRFPWLEESGASAPQVRGNVLPE